MIIKCEACLKKFLVNDKDISSSGRMVQCGFCSNKWFQLPLKKKQPTKHIPKKKELKSKKIESVAKDVKEINPSEIQINNKNEKAKKQLPDIYKHKTGIGFFGNFFIIIIIMIFIIGILETFKNELLIHFPAIEYIFETFENIIIIIKGLFSSY